MTADEQLAALLDGLAADRRAGQSPDVERAAATHPALAKELRELWAVAQFADLARGAPVAAVLDPLPPSGTASAANFPRTFGDFELLGELGRGGMGVVYKARQRSLGRVVALKMVREAHLASDADGARFQAEAAAAARLKHPNIVTVYEVGETAGQAWFCMEFVDGPSLAEALARDGPPAPRDAARLVAAVARAVHHAHEAGILHRDLKPANILLQNADSGVRRAAPAGSDDTPSGHSAFRGPNPAWVPKVADFGLARRMDGPEGLTRTGDIVGTPSYMAPEQASARKDLTPAADVYALGAILYELLTGRPPFRASRRYDTILMVLEQEPVPPRDLNPSVERDLELVCLKCLQKPPGLRYPTAAALAADLEAYAAGESVSTGPSGLGYFVARLMRETHHAEVLENWGVLWMWHSLMIFLLCLVTQFMAWAHVESHAYYLAIWTAGLCTWGTILWQLRRRPGPVLFVERQIAHAWAAGVCASVITFVIEVVAGHPPLTLSPAIAVSAGMVFVFKAGILSGQFYYWAGLSFLAAIYMAAVPGYAHLGFGIVSAVCFFAPGLKYYRRRVRGRT